MSDMFDQDSEEFHEDILSREDEMFEFIASLEKKYAWDESEHPRHEKGSEKGGEFAPKALGSVEHLVEAYLDTDPIAKNSLSGIDCAAGSCKHVAFELHNFLSSKGIESEFAILSGFKKPIEEDLAAEWKGYEPTELGHIMLKVGDRYIDITGAQFGRKYAGVRFLSLSKVKAEWSNVRITDVTDVYAESDEGDEHSYFNPHHRPAGSSRGGEFAPKAGGGATEFYSPNEEDSTDFAAALKDFRNSLHEEFIAKAKEIDGKLGLKNRTEPALGDTKTWGTELSVASEYGEAISYEDLRVSAALKGWLANQKGVAIFKQDDNGEQTMLEMSVPSDYSINDIRKVLDETGVEFRTLIPKEDGSHTIMALDFDGSGTDAMLNASKFFDTGVNYVHGRGEIIEGSDGSRESARLRYEAIINESKAEGKANSAWDWVRSLRRYFQGAEEDQEEVDFDFPGHKGRPGKRGGSLPRSVSGVFKGEPVKTRADWSKLRTGEVGEAIAIKYLKAQGLKDARKFEFAGRNNLPIDVIQDHKMFEVKAGLISNRADAQKWRLTIGQPGVKETQWLKTASETEKAKWNANKSIAIVKRKRELVAKLSKRLGRKVNLKTIGIIIHPDKKMADVHIFDGAHPIIRWKSPLAENGYVGTVKF